MTKAYFTGDFPVFSTVHIGIYTSQAHTQDFEKGGSDLEFFSFSTCVSVC